MSVLFNPVEVLIVHKQATPNKSFAEILKELKKNHGFQSAMALGLGAWIASTAIGNVVFFLLLKELCDLFDTKLEDYN